MTDKHLRSTDQKVLGLNPNAVTKWKSLFIKDFHYF